METNHTIESRRAARLAAALVLVAVVAAPAHAGEVESRTCRKAIATSASKAVKAGLGAVDTCHKSKDKVCSTPGGRGACTVLPDFDQKLKYADAKSKGALSIAGKCNAVADVAANYPGGAIVSSLLPYLDGDVTGTSGAIDGTADLLCDPLRIKCRQAIGASRSAIVNEALKNATRCQQGVDAIATNFGKIDASCISGAAAKAAAKAISRISSSCTDRGISGVDVGSCDPLPGCVVDAALLTANSLAAGIYSQLGSLCGNGLVEGAEQCDDGNVGAGDGCNGNCELEGNTCDGSYAGTGAANGTRVVTVRLTTPEPLSGVQVVLDYPQFQAGIPGIGNSSLVNSRVAYLQAPDLSGMNDSGSDVNLALVSLFAGFTTGDLARITFDNCVSAGVNVCNRNQNVLNCCNDAASASQFARCSGDGTTPCGSDGDCAIVGGTCGPPVLCPANPPSCGTAPAPGVLGACSTNGGCPGDNACVSQTSIMTCAVSSPTSLATTLPVPGVTCTVSVSEVP